MKNKKRGKDEGDVFVDRKPRISYAIMGRHARGGHNISFKKNEKYVDSKKYCVCCMKITKLC